MTLFVLHKDPTISARMLCDQHVEEAPSTIAQILCTVAHQLFEELIAFRIERGILEGKKEPLRPVPRNIDIPTENNSIEGLRLLCSRVPLPKQHDDHPCVLWAKQAEPNWQWLLRYGYALCWEYKFRFGFHPPSEGIIRWVRLRSPRPRAPEATPFPQLVPEPYKRPKATWAYRTYYWEEQRDLAKWERGRPSPRWWRIRDRFAMCPRGSSI